MFGKKSIGKHVAADMNNIMQNENYLNMFAGPSAMFKSASKKKEEEEKEDDKKDKDAKKPKDEKAEKDDKKKSSKKKAYLEAVDGLNKIAEIFDVLGLEKSAYAATKTLVLVVKEAQEKEDCLYDDDNAALTHDHEHTHSEENPKACHSHPDLGYADDLEGYTEEEKKTLKELEDAFGGPEKLKEMIESGQFFDKNSDDDEPGEGPSAGELLSGESPLSNIMDDVELPDDEEKGAEPVELSMGDDVKGEIMHALENMSEEDVEFVYNMIKEFGQNPSEAVEMAKNLGEKIKEEGASGMKDFRLKAMIVFAPMIKQAKVKARNRPAPVFQSTHPKVKDNKDHFPINDEKHGRNALAQVNKYTAAPDWWSGSLKELQNAVVKAVHSKFPGIKISEEAKKPKKAEFLDVDNMLTIKGSSLNDVFSVLKK